MWEKPSSVKEYIANLPPERKEALSQLRKIINDNIPDWFEECINYGMIGRVVPHSLYPDGYHCDPSLPLPFMNLASQKSHVAVYHMWVYSLSELKEWFEKEYASRVSTKLNMGKSCIRFKKVEQIPYDLIGELASKMTPQQVIEFYEDSRKWK